MNNPLIPPALQPVPRLEELRIECVTFDPAGLPKRRRLVSFLAMLQPLAARQELTRRRVLKQAPSHI
ncbi:MAG: hypothetical protein CFE34_03600 [Rhodobacteraceae bacterium PARR1]|nr:MAG: hypothetical protein CFE34_03600 [Rhodobacteraceae bacterium PARR1]